MLLSPSPRGAQKRSGPHFWQPIPKCVGVTALDVTRELQLLGPSKATPSKAGRSDDGADHRNGDDDDDGGYRASAQGGEARHAGLRLSDTLPLRRRRRRRRRVSARRRGRQRGRRRRMRSWW